MGSVFGHGTFKQRLLETATEMADDEDIDAFRLAEAMMEVTAQIVNSAYRRKGLIQKMYEDAKRAAKDDLVARINN